MAIKVQNLAATVILLAVFSFLGSSGAYACSCIPNASPEKALRQAGAVFAGRVVDIQKPRVLSSSMEPATVVFETSRFWKGLHDKQVSIYTPSGGGPSCGFEFQKRQEYLVYANESDSELYVSLCSRTALLTEASEDLSSLGAGSPVSGTSEDSRSSAIPRVQEILVGLLAVALVALVYRLIPNLETD